MARLSELRKQAKALGIPAPVILKATTVSALERIISDHETHDRPRKKSRAVKKASTRTTARKKSTTRTTRKPARKASGNSGRKASTPAKSRGAQAKRSKNSNDSGRNLLDSIDYSLGEEDGWNPRAGSAPDRIIKALKKRRGNREKVFEDLKADVYDFVDRFNAKKDRRPRAAAEDMLRYRISRTAWDYAMRTGQHEPATNRAEYNTAGTGAGTFVPASERNKKRGARKAAKPAARKASTKPARKPARAQKPAQRRTGVKVVATRKRGRKPAGSRR